MSHSDPNPAVTFHDQLAEQWEEKYAAGSFSRRAAAILDLQGGARPGEHWLDAGCGTGTLARHLARQGCRVTGVDGSARMIEVAERAAAGTPGAPAFLHVNDVVALPFAAGSFDGVVCSSVLEYVRSPPRVLTELARVLRPGGRLLVSVPNRRAWLRRALKLAHRSRTGLGLSPWPRWLAHSRHEYTRQEFTAVLGTTPLEVHSWRYYGPGLPPRLADSRYGGTLLLFACIKARPAETSAERMSR
jgi:2-polyprenyl-6-hydroxyphenyl methylase/3-demethylubiquinone-9 3-methyltransferase